MALQSTRRRPRRDLWMVASVLLALGAVGGWVLAVLDQLKVGLWPAGLSSTMVTSAAATLTAFAVLCLIFRGGWRLTGLVGLHSLIVLMLAALWQRGPAGEAARELSLTGWAEIHIATALLTYALVTLAAIAAFAAFLQRLALKRKRPTLLTRGLPPLADCDVLQLRLLQLGEAILALGLMTGMALEYVNTGHILEFNHKIVLTLAAFVVIGVLLIAHQRSGLRGRRAAQLVLLGYLLLTLGYPGVKFVTDFVVSRPFYTQPLIPG